MATETQRRKTAAEKRAEALELRAMGYSYQQVADEVGYASKGAAHKAVAQALRDIPREQAEQARELELGRLDEMQMASMNAAMAGDLFAIDRVVKIIESRAKLLGLYNLPDNSDPGAEQAKAALLGFLQIATEVAAPKVEPLPDAEDAS
jgi:transposase-like protein